MNKKVEFVIQDSVKYKYTLTKKSYEKRIIRKGKEVTNVSKRQTNF